ncbi:hypothetical protein ACW50_01700 [Salmonella enterica subsp. enterica]|nr:hypothetical protein [Salmonella enterica subsp. enterica]
MLSITRTSDIENGFVLFHLWILNQKTSLSLKNISLLLSSLFLLEEYSTIYISIRIKIYPIPL